MGTVTYLFHTIVTTEDLCLGGCSVCGTWEGEMPTDCPGHKVDQDTKDAIMNDEMDYRRSAGGWTNLGQHTYRRNKMKCLPND